MSRERTGLAFGQTARRWPTLPQMSQLLPLEGHVRARWPALPQTLQVFELATILLSRCGELGVMSRLRLVAAAGAACGARVSEQRAGGAADQGGDGERPRQCDRLARAGAGRRTRQLLSVLPVCSSRFLDRFSAFSAEKLQWRRVEHCFCVQW